MNLSLRITVGDHHAVRTRTARYDMHRHQIVFADDSSPGNREIVLTMPKFEFERAKEIT